MRIKSNKMLEVMGLVLPLMICNACTKQEQDNVMVSVVESADQIDKEIIEEFDVTFFCFG